MIRPPLILRTLIAGFALFATVNSAFPQGEDTVTTSGSSPQLGAVSNAVTMAMVDTALEQVSSASDGTSTTDYDQLMLARDFLNAEIRWRKELERLQARLNGATSQVEDLNKRLLDERTRVYAKADANQEVIEDEIKDLQSVLDDANSAFAHSKDRISAAPERRLVELERSQAIEIELRALQSTGAGDPISELFNQAKNQGLAAEYDYLSLSMNSVDALRSIDVAIRDLNQFKVSRIQPVITSMNARLAEFRDEALKQQEKETEDAMKQAALQDPALEILAASTQEYLNDRKDLDVKIQSVEANLVEFQAMSTQVSDLLDTMKKRLSISGNSPNVGALIQRGLHNLPDPHELNARRKTISQLVREIQIDLLELEIDRGENPWLRPEIDSFVNPKGASKKTLMYFINRNTVVELVDRRNTILDDLIRDKNRYFETLVAIDVAITQTVNSVDDFHVFAVTNSIWIPDRSKLNGKDLVQIPEIMGHVASSFSVFLVATFSKSSDRLGLVVAIFFLLILVAKFLKKYVHPHRIKTLHESNIWHLSVSFLFEVFVAGIVVFFIKGLIWVIDAPNVNSVVMTYPLKETLAAMVKPVSICFLLYRICGDNNIGVLQYRWSIDSARLIRRIFRRVLLPCILLLFTAGFIYRFEVEQGKEAGSRIFYLAGMVFSIFAMYKIFHPQDGIFANVRTRSFLNSIGFRYFIHWLLILWPSFLAILLTLGYVVGVGVFYSRTVSSLWLVGVMAVASGFYMRLTRSMRLRALLVWRKKRREDPVNGEMGIGVDWREFRDQGRELRKMLGAFLFLVGITYIWIDTIPALGALWEFPLLQTETSVLLTIGQLCRVLVCIVATFILSIQLPNILQVLIFSNIGTVTQGNRYALSTLLSYLVVIAGITWGSIILKIEWSSLQWIFAAVSVGLGFGMKEIFGNLFAGIMLLFERPIRVGDVVTIGVNTGKVHRIRIRSTTIRQGDKREVIVPNMDIITGQLVNWTLSDSMTRLELLVRTSMDADVDQVIGILEEEMRNSDKVLEKPEPFAILQEIGESALVFCCYAYVSEMRLRKFAKTDIQRKVLERFREQGISIPYPKYDIRMLHEDSDVGK